MTPLRGLAILLLLRPGGCRRSIRINDSHRGAQRQNNTLASGLEVSAGTHETLIPGGFGPGPLRRSDPRAGALSVSPRRPTVALQAASGPEEGQLPQEEGEAPPVTTAPPAPPKQFDLKSQAKADAKKGAGFNQFDPVLSATSAISRRFGLGGGLALVGLLAATEGNEILKSFTDQGPQPGSGEVVKLEGGLEYVDLLIGSSGNKVGPPGSVIGFDAVVMIGDRVLFNTKEGPNAKPIAFKYGQRPFQNVLCEGVEQGMKGMRPGGKRRLQVPKSLAPTGIELPDDVPLTYEIELQEVLPGYF